MDLLPLNLIIPKALIPGGVANATMVSSHPESFPIIKSKIQIEF
jgi:hypothetical protein